jgi:hypothetical protein
MIIQKGRYVTVGENWAFWWQVGLSSSTVIKDAGFSRGTMGEFYDRMDEGTLDLFC